MAKFNEFIDHKRMFVTEVYPERLLCKDTECGIDFSDQKTITISKALFPMVEAATSDGKKLRLPAPIDKGQYIFINGIAVNDDNSNYKKFTGDVFTDVSSATPTTEASASTVEDNTLPEDSVF